MKKMCGMLSLLGLVIAWLLIPALASAQSQKLEIIPPPVLTATVGKPFSATFTATLPSKWKITVLPSWLKAQSVNDTFITLSGVPNVTGNFNVGLGAKSVEKNSAGKRKKAKVAITITVSPANPNPAPDFKLAITPSVQTIVVGGVSATFTVSVVPQNSFSEVVSLLAVIPSGLALNYSPTATVDTSASIVVNAPLGFAPGRYSVTVTGSTRSGLTHTASFDVVVEAKPKTVPLSIQEDRLPDMYVGATQTVQVHIVGGSTGNKVAIVKNITTANFATIVSASSDSVTLALTKPTIPGPYAVALSVTDESNPTNHTEKSLPFTVLSGEDSKGVGVHVEGMIFKNGDLLRIDIHYDAGKSYPYKAIVIIENANGDTNRYSEMARIANSTEVVTGPDSTVSWTVKYPADKCQGSCNSKRFRARVIVLDSAYQQQHQFEFPSGTSADFTLQ